LKADAEIAKNEIDLLKISAQADHDTIEALIGENTIEYLDETAVDWVEQNNFIVDGGDKNWYWAKLHDLVFFNFVIYENSQSLSSNAIYTIGTIGNTDLRPSTQRAVYSGSLHFGGEQTAFLEISSNGTVEARYNFESGDTTHRIACNGWYQL